MNLDWPTLYAFSEHRAERTKTSESNIGGMFDVTSTQANVGCLECCLLPTVKKKSA